VRLPVRAVAPIAECLDPAVFVPVEDLVAGLARNSELGAQRRHLLALEQARDKPESLVHDVTLLPRHAPSWWGQSVTHPPGIRCYLSLRKDSQIPHIIGLCGASWASRRPPHYSSDRSLTVHQKYSAQSS